MKGGGQILEHHGAETKKMHRADHRLYNDITAALAHQSMLHDSEGISRRFS